MKGVNDDWSAGVCGGIAAARRVGAEVRCRFPTARSSLRLVVSRWRQPDGQRNTRPREEGRVLVCLDPELIGVAWCWAGSGSGLGVVREGCDDSTERAQPLP